MKQFLFLLLVSLIMLSSSAQTIGIGTTTPNSSAQLDIASTNKGLLLPRMSSFNRALIINPANGLLVYDTTQNRLYQYQDGNWRYLINSTYWVQSTTRNYMYNSTDSIGVGTTSPSQRLDVNGNIRSRDDVLADGRVIATGLITGGGLSTSGALTVSSNALIGGNLTSNGTLGTNSNLRVDGTSTLTGDITASGDLLTNGTLQLRNASDVNKGFIQLSADNLRLGTNSGNTQSVIFRLNGNDRTTMYSNGDINIEGKLTNQATSGFGNLLPLCYGTVKNNVLVRGTSNVTVSWVNVGTPGFFQTGYYTINCTGITNNSIIIVTENSRDDELGPNYIYNTKGYFYSNGVARVFSSLHILAAAEVYTVQSDFSFVIYNY